MGAYTQTTIIYRRSEKNSHALFAETAHIGAIMQQARRDGTMIDPLTDLVLLDSLPVINLQNLHFMVQLIFPILGGQVHRI